MKTRFGLTIQREFFLFILLLGFIPAVIGVALASQAGAYLFVRTMGGPLPSRARELANRLDRLYEGYDSAIARMIEQRGNDFDGLVSDVATLGNGVVDAVARYSPQGELSMVQAGTRRFELAEARDQIKPLIGNVFNDSLAYPDGYFMNTVIGSREGSAKTPCLMSIYPAPGGALYVFLINVDGLVTQIRTSLAEQNDVCIYSLRRFMITSTPGPPGLLEFANKSFRSAHESMGMKSWRTKLGGRWVWYLLSYCESRRFTRLQSEGRADASWVVFISYDMEDFLSAQNSLAWISITIALVWGLVLTVISVWAARRITGPIRSLRAQAEAMASGALDARVSINTQDEIQDLGAAFNVMAGKLQESYASITKFNSELEAKVRERTRDLQRANQKLVQTEKYAATARLAANLAHEINNPLGIIKNYLKLVTRQMEREGGAQPQAAGPVLDRMRIMNEELDRIARIVRQLLDLHRPVGEEVRATNVNAILGDLLDLMEKELAERGIEVKRDLDPCVPDLMVSPDLVRQVLLNLLRNAEDAMDEQTRGVLTVKTEVREEGSGGESRRDVVISVGDTGCGIKEEDLPKIFDPFFTTKSSEKGTGLGLAVSYGVIQSYGGLIEAQSKPGEGTTMVASLPVEPLRRESETPKDAPR